MTILEQELMKDTDGNWRAIKVEKSPIVNALNRVRRFKLLNYNLFDEDVSGNPLLDWTICNIDETEDEAYYKVCVCGQPLTQWYVVEREGERCNIGCGCITHFDQEFMTDMKRNYH